MKAYLVTTCTLFALLALVHVWRVIAEWPRPIVNPGFALEMFVVIVLPAALSWWAWRLLRTLPKNNNPDGDQKTPQDDSAS